MPDHFQNQQRCVHALKKSVSAAVLRVDTLPAEWPPALPKRPGGGAWHASIPLWWESVWSSPMAAEYLVSDIHQLLRLAALIDAFNRGGFENASRARLYA